MPSGPYFHRDGTLFHPIPNGHPAQGGRISEVTPMVCSTLAPRPHWHKAFLALLPAILRHAKIGV